jgi:hypothetical protein
MAKDTKNKKPRPRPNPDSALVRAFGQNMTASRYFGLDEDGNSTRGIRGQIRPTERPAGLAERAELRKAMDSSDAALRASKREAADREAGMKAGGKVKKMQAGGKCRGMGKATRGGNFSRG